MYSIKKSEGRVQPLKSLEINISCLSLPSQTVRTCRNRNLRHVTVLSETQPPSVHNYTMSSSRQIVFQQFFCVECLLVEFFRFFASQTLIGQKTEKPLLFRKKNCILGESRFWSRFWDFSINHFSDLVHRTFCSTAALLHVSEMELHLPKKLYENNG